MELLPNGGLPRDSLHFGLVTILICMFGGGLYRLSWYRLLVILNRFNLIADPGAGVKEVLFGGDTFIRCGVY